MIGPLPYIGGKNRIAKKIIEIFPAHTTYVEVFAGGAQVLFHKEPSTVEVLNDLDGDVVNFFRICQSHYEELIRYLKFILASRRWFALFEAENPESLTDIQRAARFFYFQKNAFAGLVRRRKYSYAVAGPSSFNPGRIPQLLENVHKRLERVQIECLPYSEILKRFDRPTTLFYLDPPYHGRSLYRFNFTDEDFVKLGRGTPPSERQIYSLPERCAPGSGTLPGIHAPGDRVPLHLPNKSWQALSRTLDHELSVSHQFR